MQKLDRTLLASPGVGSRRPSVVEVQQSAKPFTVHDRSRAASRWREQPIPDSLVVSLAVVVRLEFPDRPCQRPLAKQDHPLEAIRLGREYEPLRVRTTVWRSGWNPNELHAVIPEDLFALGRVLRIAIDDEVGATAKKAIVESDPIERGLLHKGGVRSRRRADYLDFPALQAQREQHVVGDETSRRPHLRREEVCCGEG